MTISTIWEPVQDAADESGGSSGSRGRGGRRSSSIIAGRRPARRAGAKEGDEAKSDSSDSSDSEEERPRTPRRRRRTTAKAEEAAPENSSESEESEAKPAPRRRRRTPAKAEPAAEAPEAAAEAEEPVAEAPAAEESAEEATEPVAEEATEAPTRRRTTRRAASSNGATPDLAALSSMVEEQGAMLSELRAGLLTLGEQLDRAATKPRVGVFVDVPNLMYGQEPDEKPINMGKLLDFLRQGRDIVRATAYSPVSDNPSEPLEQQKFVVPFVPYEYRIVTKPLKRFADGSIKGNFDVEMAIDMLTMADRLDVIAIISGDADFARAVEVVQTRGVRVEVVAFARSSSLEMRSLADRYVELGAVIDQLV